MSKTQLASKAQNYTPPPRHADNTFERLCLRLLKSDSPEEYVQQLQENGPTMADSIIREQVEKYWNALTSLDDDDWETIEEEGMPVSVYIKCNFDGF